MSIQLIGEEVCRGGLDLWNWNIYYLVFARYDLIGIL